MRPWIHNLLGIGRVTQVDDRGELQLLQVTEGAAGSGFADQVSDKVPRVAEFGFASVPPLDSEVLLLRRNGDRSTSLVVSTSHRPSRPRGLAPGDAGIYDVRGAEVMLTATGCVIDCAGLPCEVRNTTTVTVTASQKVRLVAPAIELAGPVTVTGTLSATGEITADMNGSPIALGALRDAYNVHKHGQVKAGTDVSAVTDHLA